MGDPQAAARDRPLRVRDAPMADGRFTAELLPCAVRRSMGDGHSSGFLWWPVEEQCSFAPSPELRLEMLQHSVGTNKE